MLPEFHSNKPQACTDLFCFSRGSIQFKLLFIFHPVWYINVDCHRFEECIVQCTCTYHKYNQFQTLRTLGLPCTSFCLFVCFLFYIKINHIEIEQRVPTRRWKSSFIGTQANHCNMVHNMLSTRAAHRNTHISSHNLWNFIINFIKLRDWTEAFDTDKCDRRFFFQTKIIAQKQYDTILK